MYINLFSRSGLLPLNFETNLNRRRYPSTARGMGLFHRTGLKNPVLISNKMPVIGGSAGVGLGNSIGDDPNVGGDFSSTDTQISVQSTPVIGGLTMTTGTDTAATQASVTTYTPNTPPTSVVSNKPITTPASNASDSTYTVSTIISTSSSHAPQPSVQVQSSAAAANASNNVELTKSLSGGTIVGIVFGVLFFALAIGLLLFRTYSIRKRSRRRQTLLAKPFVVATTRTILTDRPGTGGGAGSTTNLIGANAGSSGTNSGATTAAPKFNLKIPRVKPPPLSLVSIPGPGSAGLDSGSNLNRDFGDEHRLSFMSTSANSTNSSMMVQMSSASPSVSAAYGALTNVGVVRCIFEPRLPDELSIRVGDPMRVLAEYDDGWGLCENVRGERGMVPLQCLDRGMEEDGGLVRPALERVSMYSGPGRTMRQSSLPALV